MFWKQESMENKVDTIDAFKRSLLHLQNYRNPDSEERCMNNDFQQVLKMPGSGNLCLSYRTKKSVCGAYTDQWMFIKSFIFRKGYENMLNRGCYMYTKDFYIYLSVFINSVCLGNFSPET